jgi:hypothetical protein
VLPGQQIIVPLGPDAKLYQMQHIGQSPPSDPI